MLSSGIPAKFPIIWGASAAYINAIPTTSQIGINPGFASLPDGFVPLNQTPVSAGGVPPRIQDINGILNELAAWSQWQQAGGAIIYDGTFQASVGGYPNRAIVCSATTPGNIWVSTADSNTTNPDAAGAGWVNFFAPVFVSPAFTGNPTAPTQAVNDNSTNLANTAYADRSSANALAAAETYAAGVASTAQSNAETYSLGLFAAYEQPQGTVVQQSTGGGGGTIAPAIGFSTGFGGILSIVAARNNQAAFSGATTGIIYINSVAETGSITTLSQSNSWSGYVGPGGYTVQYATTGTSQYDVNLSIIFTPYHHT